MAARVLSRCVRSLNRGVLLLCNRCDVTLTQLPLTAHRLVSHLAAGHKPLLQQ
ncbi:NADH:ubiquinone oxidoreductase subunit AB1a, partial [Tachysurus ichikawai]